MTVDPDARGRGVLRRLRSGRGAPASSPGSARSTRPASASRRATVAWRERPSTYVVCTDDRAVAAAAAAEPRGAVRRRRRARPRRTARSCPARRARRRCSPTGRTDAEAARPTDERPDRRVRAHEPDVLGRRRRRLPGRPPRRHQRRGLGRLPDPRVRAAGARRPRAASPCSSSGAAAPRRRSPSPATRRGGPGSTCRSASSGTRPRTSRAAGRRDGPRLRLGVRDPVPRRILRRGVLRSRRDELLRPGGRRCRRPPGCSGPAACSRSASRRCSTTRASRPTIPTASSARRCSSRCSAPGPSTGATARSTSRCCTRSGSRLFHRYGFDVEDLARAPAARRCRDGLRGLRRPRLGPSVARRGDLEGPQARVTAARRRAPRPAGRPDARARARVGDAPAGVGSGRRARRRART